MAYSLTEGPTAMTVRSIIFDQIEQVAREQKRQLVALTDDLALIDSGLDSLCFAILVARLEDKIGVDPFSSSDDVAFPETLGEFIQVYENAAA
jgi:acyl carrier protein